MKAYCFRLQLRFSDYDSQKVVNHTKIYALIEAAYTSFFTEKINKDWTPDFMPLSLRKSVTDFLIPVKHGAQPFGMVKVAEVGGSSFTLSITLTDEQTKRCYVECTRLLVFINQETHKPGRIPEEVRINLNTYM